MNVAPRFGAASADSGLKRAARRRVRMESSAGATRKRKRRYDERRYRRRNVIERFFRRIKQCRRVATRYEKKAANFAGFVRLAAFVTGSC